jgi:hypothetical protein
MKKVQFALVALLAALTVGSYAQGVKQAHHKFSAGQARAIALKKYPGKIVGKVELEDEEGKWQYAVTIRSKKTLREVMVGADTGKIENVEVTTAAKEAKEKAAEKAKKPGKAKAIGEKDEDEKGEKGEAGEGRRGGG